MTDVPESPPEPSVSPEAVQMARDTERAQVVAYLRARAPTMAHPHATARAALLHSADIIEGGGHLESAPEPSPPVRSAATEKACDHSGIGLPGCEACDMSTDRNQDRRRRGESPTCLDCGGRGELDGEVLGRRWCQACQVTFGWMVRARREDGAPYVWCGRSDPTFPGHICGLRAGHAVPCRMEAIP